jgi:hypothetical protein
VVGREIVELRHDFVAFRPAAGGAFNHGESQIGGQAMSTRDQLPPVTTRSLGSVLRAAVRHRGVQVAGALWVIGHIVVLWLARGSLPFDRPAVAHLPFASQMAVPTFTLIEIFVLMVLTFLLTRKAVIPAA